MSRKDLLKTIQKNTGTLKTYGVKKMGVFGSFGTSRQHSKSDVDILVEFNRKDKTFDNYMDLKLFLEKLFKRRVDLVITDALKTRIKDRVLSETSYARL